MLQRAKPAFPARQREAVAAIRAAEPAPQACTFCGKVYARGEVPDEYQCECGGVIEPNPASEARKRKEHWFCPLCFLTSIPPVCAGCGAGALIETADPAGLEAILQRTDVRQASRAIWLAERGVTDRCPSCDGDGRKMYANTSTWRKGFGGQAITHDVCDVCWGTGDRFRQGVNLREWRDRQAADTARHAVELLARAAGAPYEHCREAVTAIVALLRREAVTAGRRRVIGVKAPRWMSEHLTKLADTLENGIRRGE